MLFSILSRAHMKSISLLICPLLFAAAAEAAGPTWEALLATSEERMAKAQEVLGYEHGLVDYERYDMYSVGRGRLELAFSNGGVPGVKASAIYIGSYDTATKVWLWGWADGSLPTGLNTAVKKVLRYGQRRGFERLVQPSFVIEQDKLAGLAAIANHLLDGKGIYRAPDGGSWTFVVLTDIKAVPR